MFTLVLSYLVTCFRNQATRLFLVAALRSKLILGTIRNFTYWQEMIATRGEDAMHKLIELYLTGLFTIDNASKIPIAAS